MDWTSLAQYVHVAQAAPGFDPSTLLTQGPLGVLAVFMFYLWRRSEDRMDKMAEAHKIEVAAERKLNADKQDQQLADQKVLIPLAQNMTEVAKETLAELRDLRAK